MLSSSTVRTVLAKPFMSPVFFFSGVAYDTLTLTRIDRLQDNLLAAALSRCSWVFSSC